MAKFVYWNENPQGNRINDCVTRAITFATKLPYKVVRRKLYHSAKLLDCEKLCPTCYSFLIQEVLGGIPKNCDGYSIGKFADRNPQGTYLIRIQGHLTVIKNCVLYDTWNCLHRKCDMAWKLS